VESLWPSSIEGFLPRAHRHGSDSEAAHDLSLREAGAEQGEALQASFLKSGSIKVGVRSSASCKRGEHVPETNRLTQRPAEPFPTAHGSLTTGIIGMECSRSFQVGRRLDGERFFKRATVRALLVER
jgi:hypothetical protein